METGPRRGESAVIEKAAASLSGRELATRLSGEFRAMEIRVKTFLSGIESLSDGPGDASCISNLEILDVRSNMVFIRALFLSTASQERRAQIIAEFVEKGAAAKDHEGRGILLATIPPELLDEHDESQNRVVRTTEDLRRRASDATTTPGAS